MLHFWNKIINSLVWIIVNTCSCLVFLNNHSYTYETIRKFPVLKTQKWKAICWMKLLLLMTRIFRIYLCLLYLKFNTTEEKSLNFFAKLCRKFHTDKLSWEVWLKSVFSTTSSGIYSVETWWSGKDYSFGILFNTAWSSYSVKDLWCFLV